MKKQFFILLCLFIFSAALCPGISSAEGPKNAVNAGGWGLLGPDLSAHVKAVEYERLLSDNLSVLGRVSTLDYDYDDSWYEEDGDGLGLGAGIRYYFSGSGLDGFYLGGSLGYWDVEYDFDDDDDGTGKGESKAINVSVEGGYRFMFTKNFGIVPNARIGNFFTFDEECSLDSGAASDSDSELGFYVVIGVLFTFSF